MFTKPPPGVQINRLHPLASGLVGCWLFNEGSGLKVNDLSGNNNHGTLTNFEPFSSTSGWSGSSRGTTLQFDGTDDLVDCGNNESLNIVKSITIESLIFLKGFGETGFGRIIDKQHATSNSYSLLVISGNATIGFVSGASSATSLAGSMTLNKLIHSVISYNGSDVKFYIDGILNRTVNFTTNPPSSTNKFYIGNNLATSASFNGFIYKISIWNHSLSEIEIKKLYINPYSMFGLSNIR